MTLNSVLVQLLNRSIMNPGKPYRTTLERGLEVAFLTNDHVNKTTIQISRPNPSKPSSQEMVTCLEAINVVDPSSFLQVQLNDSHCNYLQVSFAALRR